jgi:outer membrane protein assembly factor BamB
MALDPLTGKPLWTREGIAPGTELFGDEQLLYAVPTDARQAVVYNALDGTIVGNRALPPALWRLDTIGRKIVAWRTENRRQVLALFDPWTGKDLWARTFEDTAQVTLVELDEAAVLEPSGKFTVVSLSDGSIRFSASAEPEPQLRQIHVLRSNDHYVLVANQATGNVIPGWLPVTPQTIAIRGRIYGYDRSTGKRLWTNEFDRHGIELHQPGSLPVVTLMCNFHAAKKDGLGLESHYGLTCIDKRSGRIVFDNREFEQFFSVEYVADTDQKQLELRLFKSIVRLTFTDKPYPD